MSKWMATAELISRDPSMSVMVGLGGKYHTLDQGDHKDIGNPTGIFCEEGEFLYGLTRILRPKRVLETGTNIGVSSRYIALALEHNEDGGGLVTIEHSPYVAARAASSIEKARLGQFVNIVIGDTLSFTPAALVDMMWLDSELNIRYKELVRFWPHLIPGGIACIHDLWEMETKEFGGVPEELRRMIRAGEARPVTLHTDHGVTVIQKSRYFDEPVRICAGV